jgi:4-hydroxybenzoate polyprenyltransferase
MKKNQTFLDLLYFLFISIRPLQLIKNLALFAPLLFSGFLFYNPVDAPPYFYTVVMAFVVFSITTSSIYLINDIVDKSSDKKHPYKQNRPIAADELPVPVAIFAALTGLFISLFLSLSFSPFFQLLIIAYIILQLAYSFKLKHLPIFDVLIIAIGFLIRIYAGAVVVELHMSVWFLLTVVSASMFLAVGKRQSERTLLKEKNLPVTRKTLGLYSQRLLDIYTGMFANATWLTYALFTFQAQPVRVKSAFERFPEIYVHLPRTLQSQKLLMLTLPLVIFGVMRYLALVYEKNKGESPEKVLLKDKTLLTTVVVYIIAVVILIYSD